MENRYRYGKRLYGIWVGIRARCYRKTHHAYSRYGGRGITVCDEWHTYEPFARWALSHGYSDDLTIERKNVDGSYCPENCTWITRGAQARNRRNNVKIEFDGVAKTGAEWSRELGLNKYAVLRRIRNGMPLEEAISSPKQKPRAPLKPVFQYDGDRLVAKWSCSKEAAENIGGKQTTIKTACQRGEKVYGFTWSYERKTEK